jgi:SAM-dependent methyltransferase
MRDLFTFARVEPAGHDVLEAGSGFGLGLVASACLGARPVGLELVPWQAEWARRCAEALGLEIRIEVGSVTSMPFEQGSMDVVLSLEAISHYLDYHSFLAEARRVLRPGGVLIVSDGNNGLNPIVRRKTYDIWATHENDDDADHPFHFVRKREGIVLTAHPELEQATARQLALLTSGMVRSEIIAATDRYVEEGVLPDRPYHRGELSVHPDHEMVMERLFNPFDLAREIEGYGFRTKLRGHWGSGGTLIRAVDKVLTAATPLTIYSARGFRIAAWAR